MFIFRQILQALFPYKHRFEIHSFSVLPTNSVNLPQVQC